MKKLVRLSVIKNERAKSAAKGLREGMYRHIGNATRDLGDKIAGYAFVAWGSDGTNYSVLRGGSPILSRLVPEFARDALSQHATTLLVQDDE